MSEKRKKYRHKNSSPKYRIEFTRLSLFLWGGGFLFVLLWIFVFGILVGRGSLPNTVTALSDIRTQLNVVLEMVSRDRSKDLEPSKEPEPAPELAFYEDLPSKKEDEKETWTPKKRVAIPKTSIPETRAQQQSASPNPTHPKIADAQYTVQIASLEEKAKADKVVKELEQDGYSAYIREREVNGKTYYRVNCGIFTQKGAAEDYAEELFKKRGDKGLVMKLSVSHE
jgi:cell division septation protein DedD